MHRKDRDFRGVNEEILALENRFRFLSDDKLRAEQDQRARLERTTDDVCDTRKQIEEMKHHIGQKSHEQAKIQVEQNRLRVLLE